MRQTDAGKQNKYTGRWLLPFLLCGLVGFAAGCVNGLLGAAGGILLVSILPYLPAPALLSGGSIRRPVGSFLDSRDIFATALSVMLPVSAVSLVRYWLGGIRPDIGLTASLLLPSAAGGFLGAVLLDRLSPRHLRLLFALLIFVSGARMIFS